MIDVYSRTQEAIHIDQWLHRQPQVEDVTLCQCCKRNAVTVEGIQIEDITLCDECIPEQIENAADILACYWKGDKVAKELVDYALKIMKEITGRI